MGSHMGFPNWDRISTIMMVLCFLAASARTSSSFEFAF